MRINSLSQNYENDLLVENYYEAEEIFSSRFNCDESQYTSDDNRPFIIKKYYMDLRHKLSIIDLRIKKSSDQEEKLNLLSDKLNIIAALSILNSGLATSDLKKLINSYKNALIIFPAK